VDEGDRRRVDRLTIQEAARRLGVSEGAVRKRVRRGTLEHHKDEDGRVYVYLDDGVDDGVDEGADPNSNALISQLRDEVVYLRDENRRKDEIIMQQATTMRQLTAAPPQEPSEARESPESSGPTDELEELREELDTERTRRQRAESTLREGMDEEHRRREAAERERDELRRELFARREQREPPETARGEPERAQPQPVTVESQEGVRRPWWRRVFRG
jgi:excisionase family DNA binding protein